MGINAPLGSGNGFSARLEFLFKVKVLSLLNFQFVLSIPPLRSVWTVLPMQRLIDCRGFSFAPIQLTGSAGVVHGHREKGWNKKKSARL